MRRNPKINSANVGHFRTFRDPLHLAAEARRAKAWRSNASPAETPLNKAIETLATEAAGLWPIVDWRKPGKDESAEVQHPEFPGVTLRACLRYDPDMSFDDLMGDGVDLINPSYGESAASSEPWTLRRAVSGGEIASIAREDKSHRAGPRNFDGPVDLDVREIVKGHLDCGPKGLSRHSRWEAAKASGFNAAADYRRQREAWGTDRLTAIRVEVTAHGPEGRELNSGAIGGLDFDTSARDRAHIAEVTRDLARKALSGLPEAFAKRRTELEALAAQYGALSPAEVSP